MLRVFVDSGSSIKQEEAAEMQVEILPLHIYLGEKEYRDGIDLSFDTFYDVLIHQNIFPKTSLPSLGEAEDRVRAYLDAGDEVLILPIASCLSGTCHSLKMLFSEEEHVHVVETRTAAAGIRFLVEEVNRHRDEPIEKILARLEDLIPRIYVIAVPATLDYLLRGGRLSKTAWRAGSIMQLKPLIGLDGSAENVKVYAKAIGLKRAMTTLADWLDRVQCDPSYGIIPTYTYNPKNVDALIANTDPYYHPFMREYDHVDAAVACHWGPDAFGYGFVAGK